METQQLPLLCLDRGVFECGPICSGELPAGRANFNDLVYEA